MIGASGVIESHNSVDLDLAQTFANFVMGSRIYRYIASVADTVSNCLGFIYRNVKEWSFSDNGNTASACTRNDLFPLLNPGSVNSTTQALKNCWNSIYSPLTLNPHLADIGVSLSDTRRFFL